MKAPVENNHPIALVRAVSDTIGNCQLTHVARQPIDLDRAQTQHDLYVAALKSIGCEVHYLDPLPDLPDAVFVEDTAVVLDEIALITRPGAPSRQPETASTARALKPLRPVRSITAPAALDGGDVLVLGKHLWIGQCEAPASGAGRSNQAAIVQLSELLAPFGYTVHGASITNCLHLKSAVTVIGQDHLLVNPNWVDPAIFKDFESIRFTETHPDEPEAANALLISNHIIYPDQHPRTRERLEALNLDVIQVPADELAKAEGGITCCSIILN